MKLNIGTKFYLSFTLVMVFVAAITVIGYLGMGSMSKAASHIYDDAMIPTTQLGTIDTSLYWIRGDIYKYILIPEQRESTKAEILAQEKAMQDQMNAFRTTELSAAEQQSLDSLDTALATYISEADKIMTLTASGQASEAIALCASGGAASNARIAANTALIDLITLITNEALSLDLSADHTYSQSSLIIIGVAIFVAVFGTILLIFLVTGITGPINRVKKAMQKMAAGDLTEKINIKSKDEVGAMAKAYEYMRTYLNKLVIDLKKNADQLTAAGEQLSTAASQANQATQQVATSSQQMAKGAQEQSSNAQETAKSIEQLSGVINQVSQGAGSQSAGVKQAVKASTDVLNILDEAKRVFTQISEESKQAADTALAGAGNSKQTLSGMDKIKTLTGEVSRKIEELGARSAEIGKIVAVIDDIAAQTNLLALNAAIEAARAGEQGRGFAVVSDEVRKLAERTATATKEIADLIGSVQKGVTDANEVMLGGNAAVTEGYDLVVKAGRSLEQIQQSSLAVNSKIEKFAGDVTNATSITADLVNAIDNVGKITEENTAAAEQMTANATQVNKSIETVAGIAEENSAATEEVSASAQEMNAQAEEIVASAQTLMDMSVNMAQSVAMFKTADIT
jgi:methyl-accepting chemotaxis protein